MWKIAKVTVVALLATACFCVALDQGRNAYFRACVEHQEGEYEKAVKKLLRSKHVENFLNRKSSADGSWKGRLIAEILLARLHYPKIFENYHKYVEELVEACEENRGYVSFSRLVGASLNLVTFCMHPEGILGPHGGNFRPPEARDAARMAVLEHCLKFWRKDSENVQCQVLLGLGALWDHPKAKPQTKREKILIKKVHYHAYRNRKRARWIRAHVMTSYLPRLEETGTARDMMSRVYRNDRLRENKKYERSQEIAGRFLWHHAPELKSKIEEEYKQKKQNEKDSEKHQKDRDESGFFGGNGKSGEDREDSDRGESSGDKGNSEEGQNGGYEPRAFD